MIDDRPPSRLADSGSEADTADDQPLTAMVFAGGLGLGTYHAGAFEAFTSAEPAIGEPSAGDLHGSKLGEETAAGEDLIHLDALRPGIEQDGIPAFDVRRANGDAWPAGVQTFEVDQVPQALPRRTETGSAPSSRP